MSSLKKNSIILSINTLLSRITGFLREIAIAQIFGTSIYADILNISFRLPNLLRKILGEGSASQAYVPIYCEDFSKKFLYSIFTWLFAISTIISISLVYFMPKLFSLMAPGFVNAAQKMSNDNYSESLQLGIWCCKVSSFYLIFIVLSAILGASLNARKKFFEFAFMPVLGNLVMICGIYYIYQASYTSPESIKFLSIIFLLSGLIQFLFIIWSCYRIGISIRLNLSIDDKVIKFFKNLGILSFGTSIGQINIFISQSLCTLIPGCVSILNYADRIYQLPLSVIAASSSTVLLTEFSSSKKDNINSVDLLTKIIEISILFTIPIMFGLIVLSKKTIDFVYHYGAFTALDTYKTGEVLAMFAISMPAFVVTRILSVVFFSNQKTIMPTIINVASILINLASMTFLIKNYEYMAPPISAAISSYFSCLLLLILSIRNGYMRLNITEYSKILIAGYGMYYCIGLYAAIFENTTKIMTLISIITTTILGIFIYYIFLRILKVDIKSYLSIK